MKAILFDFDGVLHNTFHIHRESIRSFSGYPLTEQEYRDMHNENIHKSPLAELKDMDWLAYRDSVRDIFKNLSIEESIRKTLQYLSKKYSLFIVTSGGEDVIGAYLRSNKIDTLFQAVLGHETHKLKTKKFEQLFQSYNFSPKESIFVTDTLGDILEANEVGLTTVAVDFGFHPRETLEKGHPYTIISDFCDLISIAKAYESRE